MCRGHGTDLCPRATLPPISKWGTTRARYEFRRALSAFVGTTVSVREAARARYVYRGGASSLLLRACACFARHLGVIRSRIERALGIHHRFPWLVDRRDDVADDLGRASHAAEPVAGLLLDL